MARAAAPERLHVETPLVRSEALSAAMGREVMLKLENAQPSGSFKLRGIGATCAAAKAAGASEIVSSSGGNAGLAAAYAARALGLPCEVCVPSSTPEFVRARLESYGAKVTVHGSQWAEANAFAEKVCAERNGAMVHPFEGEATWDGNASLVDEIKEQLGGAEPAAIVASVGGGGLLMGVLRGVDRNGWGESVRVVACETHGANCLAAALDAGELVTLPGITSIAKSLGADRASPTVFDECTKRAAKGLVSTWTCTDEDAAGAAVRLSEDQRVLVEPACGAALAAAYGAAEELRAAVQGREGPVVVVCCGGAIVTRELLAQWAELAGM
eukprot:PRCOL_00002689-RA